MDKQTVNHNKLVNDVITILKHNGINPYPEKPKYFSRLSNDEDSCHIIVHGLTFSPFKIKTAYAEGLNSNQADSYVTQVRRMRDDVCFIYNGDGWRKNSYIWATYEIGNEIGKNNIVHLRDFDTWIKAKFKEQKEH